MSRVVPNPVSGGLGPRAESGLYLDDAVSEKRHLTSNVSMERQRKREDMGGTSTTSIYRAAEFDDAVALRAFLDAGADLSKAEGYYMWTAGHWACNCNSVNALSAMADHATASGDSGALTRLFMTKSWLMHNVAHAAALQGHMESIKLLLQFEREGRLSGVLWDATDLFGRTCMDLAITQNEEDTAQLLALREFYFLLPSESVAPSVLKAKALLIDAMESHDPSATTDDGAEVSLNKALVWMVVQGCAEDGHNILSILVAMHAAVERAVFFPALAAFICSLTKELMDSCRTKAHTKALLAPLADEVRTPKQPVDAIGFCMRTGNKHFVAHPKIQAVMTEKFDPMGSYEYSSNPTTFIFWMGSACFIYSWWLVAWIPLLALRPFNDGLVRWGLKGKTTIDSRFPWHIPYNKWLASYMTFMIFVVLMSMVSIDTDQEANWKHICVAVWAVSTLVDGAQHALDMGYYTFAFRHASGVFYLIYFVCLSIFASGAVGERTHSRNLLSHANDALAVAVMCIYVQILGLWDVSPSMGPLLVMLRKTVVLDASRFLALGCILLLGFAFAMMAVFKPVCSLDNVCTVYDSGWNTDWQQGGLASALLTLEFQIFGQGAAAPWLQKGFSGAIFYTIFTCVASILLINLFIAMLSDTYSVVKAAADLEYMYTRAAIITNCGSQEPICPPMNLLHLSSGFLGNAVRRLLYGAGNFTPVVLAHTSEADKTMLFMWYLPSGKAGAQALALRTKTIGAFVAAVNKRRNAAGADRPKVVECKFEPYDEQ